MHITVYIIDKGNIYFTEFYIMEDCIDIDRNESYNITAHQWFVSVGENYWTKIFTVESDDRFS